ncbi:hypothetical protein [Streptomyces sioyaensis]|uniref:hypothetical protein n=1 Tax=Streptomyces sioyaensis TaxID=67364 RepID=UPI0037949F5D
MTPDERDRLMAEELPTGTFGYAPRTDTRRRPKPAGTGDYAIPNPVSATQAAANRRALEEAVGITTRPRRHLRAVPDQAAA